MEVNTWMMAADHVDLYGESPHEDANKGFNRMKTFFESSKNDLGATFKEIVISTADWNAFAKADRANRAHMSDTPTDTAVLDDMA